MKRPRYPTAAHPSFNPPLSDFTNTQTPESSSQNNNRTQAASIQANSSQNDSDEQHYDFIYRGTQDDMQDSNDLPLMAETQSNSQAENHHQLSCGSIVPPIIMEEDVVVKMAGSSSNSKKKNINKRKRRKHRIPGPAGESLMLTSSFKNSNEQDDDPKHQPPLMMAKTTNEKHNNNKMKQHQQLHVSVSGSQEQDCCASLSISSSQEDGEDVLLLDDNKGGRGGIIGPILQRSMAWTACCISLERFVDFYERDLLLNDNGTPAADNNQGQGQGQNNNDSSSSSPDIVVHQHQLSLYQKRIEAVHKCLNQYSNGSGESYTTIGDILTGRHDVAKLNIASKLLVVYVYSVQCHMHSDWTCELRDETGRSITGWLEERFVKDRPEGARPGAVLLLKGCSFAVFSADAVLEGTDLSSSQGQQQQQQDDDWNVERMLLIGMNTVVYSWVPEEGVHITREEKVRLTEGRRRVRAMISGRTILESEATAFQEDKSSAIAIEAYNDILIAGGDDDRGGGNDHDCDSAVEEVIMTPLVLNEQESSSAEAAVLPSSLSHSITNNTTKNGENERNLVSASSGLGHNSQESSSSTTTFVTPPPKDCFAEDQALSLNTESPMQVNTLVSVPIVQSKTSIQDCGDMSKPAVESEQVEMRSGTEKSNEERSDKGHTVSSDICHKNPYMQRKHKNCRNAGSTFSKPNASGRDIAQVDEEHDGRPSLRGNRLLAFAALASPTISVEAVNADKNQKQSSLPTNDNDKKGNVTPNIQGISTHTMAHTESAEQDGMDVRSNSQTPNSIEKQSLFNDINSFGSGPLFKPPNRSTGAKSLFEGAALSNMFDDGDFDEDE